MFKIDFYAEIKMTFLRSSSGSLDFLGGMRFGLICTSLSLSYLSTPRPPPPGDIETFAVYSNIMLFAVPYLSPCCDSDWLATNCHTWPFIPKYTVLLAAQEDHSCMRTAPAKDTFSAS